MAEQLRFLRAIGVNSLEPVQVKGQAVVPHEVLLATLRRMPRPQPAEARREYEVLRLVARGESGGAPAEVVLDCHVEGVPAWGLGIESDTGCPPSVAVQMLASGRIAARGVLPPELAVPPEPYFAELARRGMRIA
jgi:saccharopine dehydrogenase-like NADP-dependent oxidoreductase